MVWDKHSLKISPYQFSEQWESCDTATFVAYMHAIYC